MSKRYLIQVLMVCLLLASCEAPKAYQQALEAFSQGATLELQQQLAAAESAPPEGMIQLEALYSPSQAVDASRTPATYYGAALAAAETALRGEDQLRKHQMLDNTYAIQALTQWKLSQFAEALASAEMAEPLLMDDQGGENDQRDLAMVRALPGLINLDQAFTRLQQVRLLAAGVEQARAGGETARRELYQQIKAAYQEAVTDESAGATSINRGLALLKRSAELSNADEPVLIYLVNARLAGLDTWGDMLQEVFMASRRLSVSQFLPNEGEWIAGERNRYNLAVAATLEELANLMGVGEDNAVYQFWKSILQGA
ncbi:MAG: hypothetical protein KDC54_21315 [Lewinella sp.]|nr:hypothetical protein [Lewinella sp.]